MSDALATLAIPLLLEDPFWGHLLAAIPKLPAPDVADAELGVCGDLMVLWVNEHWAAAGEGREAVLRHELMHLLLRHPVEAGRAENAAFFSFAAELDAVRRLGDAADLPSVDLPPGADVWACHDYLEACWRRWLRGEAARPGWLGWLEEAGRSASHPLHKHRRWLGATGKLLPATGPAAHAGQLIHDAARRAGAAMPPGLRQWIGGMAPAAPAVDWRRQLRLFAAGRRHSRLRHTIRRPSARYGVTPGLRLERGLRLLVAVDTSASVDEAALRRFFAEVDHLYRRQGAEVTVLECDVDIRRRYAYRGEAPAFVAGRGGTLFDAPLEWANAHPRPDALIYFTDGEGPPPRTACRCPLLWVVTGRRAEHLPGRVVFMEV